MISSQIPSVGTHPVRGSKRASAALPHAEPRAGDTFELVRVDDRFTVVTVCAELDFPHAKSLERAIVRAAAASEGVVIDLLACNVCDSGSLAVMAKQKYVMREALQFVLGPGGAVRRAFEVTGLSRTSPMHATVSSAVAKLRS